MYFRFDCSENDFYTIFYKNSFFISANRYEKFILNKEYCTARQKDKTCFVPNCRYHIILIGIIKELLQKLDAFCFNYQHVYCLCTLFKYHFSVQNVVFKTFENVVKSGQTFDNLHWALEFNHQKRGVDRVPSIAKKETLEEKHKKLLLSCYQRTKSTQTSGSVFAGRIVQVKKTKFEIQLIRNVESVLDGHGKYTSVLVSFKMKSL